MATAVESATQISLPIDKEEVPDVTAPVSSETAGIPEPEAEAETVAEAQAVPEVPPVETEAEQTEEPSAAPVVSEQEVVAAAEDIPVIQNGYLQKRGLKPLRLWKNRYFGFHNEPFALAQLRLVSKKSLKASSAPREEFEKVNKTLFHNIATATVSGEGLMFYFKSSNPDHVEVPLGVINLEDVQSVATAKASKPHAFCIKTNARDYILAAPTSDEAKSWVHTIQQKLDSLSTLSNVTETTQYKETYEKLVTRQAFSGKNASTIPTGILSDSEVLSGSDNEKENETNANKETEVTETVAEPEAPVVEEAPAVTESAEDAPKRKSVFGGFKSFIKKSEKTSDSSIEVAPVAEETVEAKDTPETEVTEEVPSETPVAEQVENVVKAEEVPEATDAKANEADVDNKPNRPLSFGLPKFFKSSKKEGESAEFTETVEAEPATEVASPEVSESAAPDAVVENEVTEAEAKAPEVVAEAPEVVEATDAPVEQTIEATSVENVAEVAPGSPIKRTLSNLFRSKKSKNSESHVASVEESAETVEAEESTAEAQEVAQTESESSPAEAEPDSSAPATVEVVQEETETAEIVAEPTAELATEAENTAEVTDAADAADAADDKPKKPTLFKRMTFMLRSNTGSKSSSSTTESIPAASSSTSPEVITEAPEEVEIVEQKVEATPEPVKSH